MSPPTISTKTVESARVFRKQRVLAQLADRQQAAVLLTDPINIRYATDVSNMQVWTTHSPARYTLVCADGYTVGFEFYGSEHLGNGYETVDEVRTACNWFYFAAGERMADKVETWADEIVDIVRQRTGSDLQIAVDRLDPLGVDALRARGVVIAEGQELMEQARCIKNDDELELIRSSIHVAETGLARMQEGSLPGLSENEIWALLHYENIRAGGEWIETRLLAIGQRTNPWFQECSEHVGAAGEILAVDTDLIGPYGYCADISRSWTIGHVPFSAAQRTLYRAAVDQIEHNLGVIQAGMTFDEFNARSWRIPDCYQSNRYAYAMHGVGMADEWPGVATHIDHTTYAGQFEAGMTICLESLIGESGGNESIKLETQVLVTDNGPVRLDNYRWEDHR